MSPKNLYNQYSKRKEAFHVYLDNIKKNAALSFYTISNLTLIKNPYASIFPLKFFREDYKISNKYFLFCRIFIKFYIKNIYLYIAYIISIIIFQFYFKKTRKNEITVVIDTFGLVDKTILEGKFQEQYLQGIYEIFEKFGTDYTILLRLYQIGKNPFKLKKFFNIINSDTRDFVFEYELITLKNLVELLILILAYPFKTLRLMQKELTVVDKLFNSALIYDMQFVSLDSFTRYILGMNIARIKTIEKIYSWSEFQVIERSFNYGIRANNNNIKLIGLQFYLNYETYFNAYITDLDYDMLCSPHDVFVNGKYYVQNTIKLKYHTGVSLRYKDIFTFQTIKEEKNILLLGSYIEDDTKLLLNSVKKFKNVVFKNHPAVDIRNFGQLPYNINVSNNNLYDLFKNAQIVIVTASGTAVEAVACGLSVIIVASKTNFTANALVSLGEGKIWDIAFDENDIEKIYKFLIDFRIQNPDEIKKISQWYRDNFFSPLSDENLIRTFGFRQ